MALNIPCIPKGFVVHHIDLNKNNNDINNLALLTITSHNRIHSHKAWNKGITTKTNEKWINAVYKQRIEREKTFMIKAKETYDLKQTGLIDTAVGKILNITRRSVSLRVKKYKKFLNNNNE